MKQIVLSDYDKSWTQILKISGVAGDDQLKVLDQHYRLGTGNFIPGCADGYLAFGMPNKLGDSFTMVEMEALAEANNLNMSVYEGQTAESVKSTALDYRAEILTFEITSQIGDTVIDSDLATILVVMAYGTTVTALEPTITISENADSVDPESGEATDFTDSVEYTVTAENGDEKVWTVTVQIAPNTATAITAFVVAEAEGAVVIDAEAKTVAFNVLYGQAVTALAPKITLSHGATVDPASEEATDFTNPVVYTVTAEDGETKEEWTATATVLDNTETDITAFSLAEQTGVATIDAEAHTVAIEVANGTSLAALVATFTLSAQATAAIGETAQVSAETENDFTNPVTYTITAGDGETTQDWVVTVTEAAE